jgi:hypothetical protein
MLLCYIRYIPVSSIHNVNAIFSFFLFAHALKMVQVSTFHVGANTVNTAARLCKMTGKPNVTVLPSADESDSLFVSLRAPQALAEGLLRLLQVFGLGNFHCTPRYKILPNIFFNPSPQGPGKRKR